MRLITRVIAISIASLAAYSAAASEPAVGDLLLEKVKSLIGTWDAPMGNKVMTDTFKPFAFGTAVLGEEWLDGEQITSTIFYVVNGELRADHFRDYKNRPQYTAPLTCPMRGSVAAKRLSPA